MRYAIMIGDKWQGGSFATEELAKAGIATLPKSVQKTAIVTKGRPVTPADREAAKRLGEMPKASTPSALETPAPLTAASIAAAVVAEVRADQREPPGETPKAPPLEPAKAPPEPVRPVAQERRR